MPNWHDILNEIHNKRIQASTEANSAVNIIRRKYLSQLHEYTGRNIIAYYSGWLSKPNIRGTEINDEDKNGFMMGVHHLDRSKGLDLILHTEGGSIAATESIVNYLRQMFGNDIRAIVPQIAMSAGTMLACSCKAIVLGKQSNLGPIDPHLNGIPAQGVVDEFKRALKEVKKDPAMLPLWSLIVGQYRPTFLRQCEDAVKWSEGFVKHELENVMFASMPKVKRDRVVKNIIKKLTDYKLNRSHGKHIHLAECREMGLVVEQLEDDQVFQDLVLSVHHCFINTLMNSPAHKIIENHLGTAMVKMSVASASPSN
ncbi:MAG: S49 family peptidase [Desulfarculus sp.]|nr:S49 family peptidase [Desulfarculus sp.]